MLEDREHTDAEGALEDAKREQRERVRFDPFTVFLAVLMCLSAAALVAMIAVVATSPLRERPEQPHLYWKDIPVEVVNVDKRTWFAGTRHYRVAVTVKSEEYGLEQTLDENGSGMFGMPASWNLEKGDMVDAEMYSWVLDSTGEVQRRAIHRLILN